ncbi:hypothetical protein [Embleya scabrispora]|uniref:hypothetical protein n=1 Tax=Embleya scabrispora TaxID=159449 RepID=UPI001F2D3EA3|nr:hypothetical protein [Embleya scabrispora]
MRQDSTGGRVHTCPRCGADIVTSPTDGDLDATPHQYGPYLPGGGTLTPRQALEALAAGTAAGHRAHQCPPRTAEQLTLI